MVAGKKISVLGLTKAVNDTFGLSEVSSGQLIMWSTARVMNCRNLTKQARPLPQAVLT